MSIRLRVTLLVITMVLSVFGVRLFQIQGLDPQAYAARAQAAGLVHLDLPATRGDIVDRNGAMLAQSVSGLMIVADPQVTAPHAEPIARILADRLHLDYFDVLDQLRKPGTQFAYIARRVPAAKASKVVQEIDAAGYHGVDTRNDPLRDYPGGDVAANIIGFLGVRTDGQGHIIPAAGLEQSFNKLLSGRDGHDTYEVGGGNRIPLGENTEVRPVNGKQLKLTIDRDAQWYAQRILRQTVHQVRAQSGAVIAMDSRTGQVLAMADYPTYDANRGSKASLGDIGSRALGDVYEPGSVEKVLTASALLQQGKETPRTRIVVPPVIQVQGKPIHDWYGHGRIHLTLTGAIAKSSNIGVALASRAISSPVMGRYLQRFGLGTKTGVPVPGESRGLLPDPNSWSELTHANIAFGQGLAVNALQMTAAVNTIANGGEYISPSLILGRATTDSGRVVGSDVAKTRRVVSARTARKVRNMMEMVLAEGKGIAPGMAIPGYRVAGKTGTAQEVGAKCGCYDGSLDVSFAGIAPADHPRFTVYAVIKHPLAGASGAGTAGPVVRKLLIYLLQKYAVPPTGSKPPNLPVTW
ncbi:peptidoglycan D,D-transpeptidase FtsI family protein [Nocardioides terrisoli]|uniref:peptidoglycan D,D-transpeptidase FtsI family protein n=1 Tax=Nocardioides terrisoli TaxID=3388267 RepID=UPI00287B6EAF|nr:penicillin-binding protein 2 [Nocardioides marmorisolisilvae]